jgi:uncharacterized membrane protein YhaH (DUF805 family)
MFYYFLQALKKSFTFKGRSRRKEFWSLYLGYIGGLIFLSLVFMVSQESIGVLVSNAGADLTYNTSGTLGSIMGYLIFVYFILTYFIPLGLAVSVRRLHDIGKSGWFMLVGFIPLIVLFISLAVGRDSLEIELGGVISIVGFLYLFYLFCIKKGDVGDNQYGPDPKHED